MQGAKASLTPSQPSALSWPADEVAHGYLAQNMQVSGAEGSNQAQLVQDVQPEICS
jgi:hypothetical protein